VQVDDGWYSLGKCDCGREVDVLEVKVERGGEELNEGRGLWGWRGEEFIWNLVQVDGRVMGRRN
jgi:hypothetical protein